MAEITAALTLSRLLLVVLVYIFFFLQTCTSIDQDHLAGEIKNNGTASPKSRAIHDFYTHTSAYKTLDSKDTRCYLERMHQKVEGASKKDTRRVLFTTHKLLTKQEVFVLGGPRISEFCRAIPTFLLQHRNAYWQQEEQVIVYKTLEDAKCFIVNLPISKSFEPLNNTNFIVSSSVKLSKQALWDLGGSKIIEFCNGFTSYALQDESSDTIKLNIINDVPISSSKLRRVVKRNANYKLKSQTQSQYLNIGGTGQEPGKAEAEATRDGTKAVVIGSSGMGQAQSQSSPWNCEECYGYPQGPGRRPGQLPGDIGAPHTQPGGVTGLGFPIGQPGSHGTYGRPGLPSFGQQGAPGTYVPGTVGATPAERQPGAQGGIQSSINGTPGYPSGPKGQQGVPGGRHPGSYGQLDTRLPGTPGGRLPETYGGAEGAQSGEIYGQPRAPGYPETYRPGGVQTGQPGSPSVYQGPGSEIYGTPGTYGRPGDIQLGGIYGQPGSPGYPGGTHVGQPGSPYQGAGSQLSGTPGTYGRPGDIQPGGIYGQPGSPGYPGGAQVAQPGSPYQGAGGQIPGTPGTYGRPGSFQPGEPGHQGGIYLQPGTPGYPGTYSAPGSTQVEPGGIQRTPGTYGSPGSYISGRPGAIGVGSPGFIPDTYPPGAGISQPDRPGSTIAIPGRPGVIYGPTPGDIRYPQGPGISVQPGIGGPGTNTAYPHVPGGEIQLPRGEAPGSIISGYDRTGEFSGKVSGDYHTNGHKGQFLGVISGQYSGRGQTTTTGTGLTGTTGAGYPTAGGYYPSGQLQERGPYIDGTQYPGGRPPQTYGQDIIYPTGPSGRPGVGIHPDHELIPGAQYPGGVSRHGQTYKPGEYRPGAAGQPGAYYPGQTGDRGRPGDYIPVIGPGSITLPGEYIPGQGPTGGYIPGQGAPTGGYIPGRGPTGGYIPAQGPTGAYIPGQGPTGGYIPTIPSEIVRPGGYIPGQVTSGGYIPGQGQSGLTGLPGIGPGGIDRPGEYIPGQREGSSEGYTPGISGTILPGGIARPGEYIPGQGPSGVGYIPGQGPTGTTEVPGSVIDYIPGQGPQGYTPEQVGYIPGTQQGSYIPGQGPVGSPGLISGTGLPKQYIPGQVQIGPGGVAKPGEYIPGQIITGGRPGEYYPVQPGVSRPGEGFIPGHVQPGAPGVPGPGGISYTPGTYYEQPGVAPGNAYFRPGTVAIPRQPGVQVPGQYIRPGQVELLPGTPGYIPPDNDSDSQVQTSVQQLNNETQASASSQGKYLDGTAQSQVSGTYSGSGSFSASAGTIDQFRGAQTQIAGGAQGAMSSAQGRGGAGQSQAQVQLSSQTGDTTSSAQSGGINHGTNTQVQAGSKGGMADAQANGKGSTSSQANIGFLPHDANEADEGNGINKPFGGGGTASAQSGANVGQSQAQLNGKYRFGIKYTGSAQASSSNDGKSLPLRNISTSQMQDFKLFDFNKSTLPMISSTQTPVTTPSASSTSHSKRSGPVDYSEEDDEADEEYEEEYIETESKKKVIIPINSQHTRAQRQHLSLGRLEDLDATVIQTTHEDSVYQPGQIVSGTEFAIPSGLRGRVLSTSGQDTYAQGSNSQAQTVHLNPGTGKVSYIKPPIYAVTSNTQIRNGQGYGSGYTYQPPQYQLRNGQSYPRFVASTRSETGSKNVITGKKTPSVYYSQSSTCGYFTNSCVFSNGKKVCIPKPKLNPDGTPMIC